MSLWKNRESDLESKNETLTAQLLENQLRIDLWKKQEESGIKEKEKIKNQIHSLQSTLEEKEKEGQSLTLTLDEEVFSKLTRRQSELQHQYHQVELELKSVQSQYSGTHRSKRRCLQSSCDMTQDQLEVNIYYMI